MKIDFSGLESFASFCGGADSDSDLCESFEKTPSFQLPHTLDFDGFQKEAIQMVTSAKRTTIILVLAWEAISVSSAVPEGKGVSSSASVETAARSLISACHQIGPNLTVLHVLPKLIELFGELAFSQEASASSASFGERVKDCKRKTDEVPIDSHIDLVLLLYPPLTSLLGIEKLRQCFATWLLLE